MHNSAQQKRWWIYALIEPRPSHPRFGEPRYVGWSTRPSGRFTDHLTDARNGKRGHKLDWLRAVINFGLVPAMKLLESGVVGDDTWDKSESKWITYYREQGFDLTNANDGGVGGINPTAEIRAKISAIHKGKILSAEIRSKMSSAHTGKRFTKEHRANLSRAHKGKAPNPQSIAAALAVTKGRRLSVEHRKKLSAARIGKTRKPYSAEHRAKLAAAQTGRRPGNFIGYTTSQQASGRWWAALTICRPRRYLGTFDTKEEAIERGKAALYEYAKLTVPPCSGRL